MKYLPVNFNTVYAHTRDKININSMDGIEEKLSYRTSITFLRDLNPQPQDPMA
jgi:hypothetical protein